MIERHPKAADIPDAAILTAVVEARAARSLLWATRWDIAARFPDMPFKVVSAKLNAMVRRGLLDGCGSCHDCRGDFTVIEERV